MRRTSIHTHTHTYRPFTAASSSFVIQLRDSEYVLTPDGGQEVESSHGRQRGKSALRQFRGCYQKKTEAEHRYIYMSLRAPGGSLTA